MADDTIYMSEKDDYPREKKSYGELVTRVYFSGKPETAKEARLKYTKPLVKKVEGPFNENGELVDELEIGTTYIYKATEHQESILSLIKNIWWAEQLDDGEITDLEYKKGENPYLDDNNIVCFKYTVKKCEKVRIYAYVAKPIKPVSIESEVASKKAIAFFIGGASDKEPYYGNPATEIVKERVKTEFDELIKTESIKGYDSFYLGYNETRGDEDIQNKIIANIHNKENTAIYIIGHSLGGWNGAHLSQILTDRGYNVDLLITLDPVGVGSTVTYISDIYWGTPKPKANYWIHISTFPEDYRFDDFIADFGEQWRPKTGMQINDECSCNHGSAGFMFTKNLKDTDISASDMLLHQIKLFISKQAEK
ncbi:hypothetical protein [Tenacibaculum sp. A30]|uniref:hypothetical protein n=1 Tax=Tenacibaculum sp. A30 TaxID=3442644 RepID=UPI003EB9556C